MLNFLPIMLCCSAHKKFTYYAQNYAQEQELCLVYYHYLYKSLLNLERLFY